MIIAMCQMLLIEGRQHVHDEILQSLNPAEFVVTCVSDGAQALTVLQQEVFGIILLGLDLSTPNSADLLGHIKSNPALQRTPVVLISSVKATPLIMDQIAAGVDDYILYPFDPIQLTMRIRINIHRTGIHDAKIGNILNISERVRRVLSDPALSLRNTPDDSLNTDDFLCHALEEVRGIYNADAGTVFYLENNTLRFVVVQTDSIGINQGGTTGDPITFPPLELYNRETNEPNNQFIAPNAALHGAAINVPDVYASVQFDVTSVRAFDQINSYRTISCLAVPLKNAKGEVIGVVQLINAQDEYGHIITFDSSRQLLVESLCAYVATIISNQLLLKQQAILSKIENDIRIGRQIQQTFLPTTFPEIDGWEIGSYFSAAREVAGDFYDAFEMPNNRLGILIADVCDKGVGAALFMSLMRSLLRAYAMQNYPVNWTKVMDSNEGSFRKQQNAAARQVIPSAGTAALENAIKLTNDYVATIHGDLNMFATTFFGVLQPATGRLLYINGGHCPPFIIDGRGNIKQRIEVSGPAVGMFTDALFEIGEIVLDPEDTLFAFTDGVTDAHNSAKKLFTETRLTSLLQEPFPSVKELLRRVETALTHFIGDAFQFDDITMLAVRRQSKS